MELPGQLPYSIYGAPYSHYGGTQPGFGGHQLHSDSWLSYSAALTSNQSASTSMQHGEHEGRRTDVETGHPLCYTYCLKIFDPDKRSKYNIDNFDAMKNLLHYRN